MNRSVLRNTGMTFEQSVDEFKEFLKLEPKHIFNAKFQFVSPSKGLKKTPFTKDHSETVALALSDWHVAEEVAALEVNGMNKFNPMILANRLDDIIEKFLKIVRGHQTMYTIDKVWLPVIGDMISGSIHPELVLTNSLLDYPSAVLAARLLILAVERLKSLGLPIEMDMIVGNHARTLPKLSTKKQAHLSLDWMTYIMVEQYFLADPQVITRVHQSQIALVEVRGHRFAIEHGSGYSYAKMESLDVRLRNIFDNPTYRQATGMEGSSVDFVIIGDKHRASYGPSHLVNGCLVGASEITTSWRLSPIRAEQVMFGISNKRPLTYFYPLDVTPNRCEEANNVFSKYTKAFMAQHGR